MIKSWIKSVNYITFLDCNSLVRLTWCFYVVILSVLLLGARVAASAAAISPAEEKRAWLLLAWISTVAGNLSLLGSAANLIVCEQARRTPQLSYNLSFWNHLKFGLPSTLIVTAIGLVLIRWFSCFYLPYFIVFFSYNKVLFYEG